MSIKFFCQHWSNMLIIFGHFVCHKSIILKCLCRDNHVHNWNWIIDNVSDTHDFHSKSFNRWAIFNSVVPLLLDYNLLILSLELESYLITSRRPTSSHFELLYLDLAWNINVFFPFWCVLVFDISVNVWQKLINPMHMGVCYDNLILSFVEDC